MPGETVRIVIALPRDLHAAAIEAAARDERSLAATVRVLLRDYVERSAERG